MTGPIIPDREPTPQWMRYAACKGVDPNMFFPTTTHQGPGGMPPAVFEPAKRICAECPAIKACRNYALADPSLDGIWGGTTENERRRIRRQTRRDRSDGVTRRRSTRQLDPGDERHGTLSGYNYWGCNCDLCVAAIRTHRNNTTRKQTG